MRAWKPAPPIGTADQVRELEKRLIEGWAFPAELLMERAALALLHVIEAQHPGAPVVVLAGTGHNAGDGLALARMLADRGRTVRVLRVGAAPGEMASRQLKWLARRDVPAKLFAGSETFGPEWVLVDALFGIGLDRPLKSDAALAIEWVNRQAWRAVVAVDLPSGLHADTGQALGAAINASLTVAIGVLKPGLLADSALRHVGQLWLADIGFPAHFTDALPGRLNAPVPMPMVPPDAHKGTMGSVMIVAGSPTMSGAAILATRAACRTGVGLVYLAIPASQREMAAAAVPEAIVLPLPESDGQLSEDAATVLAPHLPRLRALAIGPGMGHTERVTALVNRLLAQYAGPVVLDADALPRAGQRLPEREGPIVMTPHAGELARMFGQSGEEVQRNRLKFGLEAAAMHQATVVFKGARTLIARPDGHYGINTTGTPMLATAGSGDVLAGLTAGLLARGMSAFEAASTGVWAHGRAAEAAKDAGMVSLMAGDIVDRVPHVLGHHEAPSANLGDAHRIR
ncbi:MAG: NAD(P)H-hydrate dehydratase [Candidatus Sericytochromatia bacterium]